MNAKKFLVLTILSTCIAVGIALLIKRLFLGQPPPPAPPPAPVEVHTDELPKPPPERMTTPVPVQPVEMPYPTGIVRKGMQVIIVMSDGTVRTEQDNIPASRKVPEAGKPIVQYVAKNYVILEGKRQYLKPKTTARSAEIFDPKAVVKEVSKTSK